MLVGRGSKNLTVPGRLSQCRRTPSESCISVAEPRAFRLLGVPSFASYRNGLEKETLEYLEQSYGIEDL
jgi:hypothetical protein